VDLSAFGVFLFHDQQFSYIHHIHHQGTESVLRTLKYAIMGSVELPKKYKAAVYDKPGSISTKIEELDMPEPGPGEVLINLYVCPAFLFSGSTT
jgi:hypothetical protein